MSKLYEHTLVVRDMMLEADDKLLVEISCDLAIGTVTLLPLKSPAGEKISGRKQEMAMLIHAVERARSVKSSKEARGARTDAAVLEMRRRDALQWPDRGGLEGLRWINATARWAYRATSNALRAAAFCVDGDHDEVVRSALLVIVARARMDGVIYASEARTLQFHGDLIWVADTGYSTEKLEAVLRYVSARLVDAGADDESC